MNAWPRRFWRWLAGAALLLSSGAIAAAAEARTWAPAIIIASSKDVHRLAAGSLGSVADDAWGDLLRDAVVVGAGAGLLLLIGGGSLWIVTLRREIRVRRQAESVRQGTEERLTLLAHALHAASDCITITDASGRVVYVNEAFLRTYGYRSEEVLGQS